ncbi:WD40 repeat protein [Phytophthora pseudosyringae]|uniref:WD40 repeat protein n=1 Tax=Phytophthora pseudosyringae TaxID=221518 RepID=A0A8T1V9F9_9STRA|nr:WD40 repeat protein [Phytophthora pseudosyringae]
MFFCSGPPRMYAAPAARARLEDVALAMHPSQRVFARVTASHVALWGAELGLPGSGRRLLARCRRGGQWAEQQLEESKGEDADGLLLKESEARQLWAAWVSGDRLAVVEKDAQSVEFYAFEKLDTLLARAETPEHHSAEDAPTAANVMLDQPSFTEPEQEAGEEKDGPKATSTGLQLAAKYVEDYPLNQGASQSDYEDVAASMSAVAGSKFVFVGMASGMICVVEVAASTDGSGGQGSWFSNADSSTKIWKIDVRTHLSVPDDAEPPSCYALACATTDLPSKIASLYLVASFEGGKCFIMLLSPAKKSIDQLLSLVNTEREGGSTASSGNGRCTTTRLDASGSRLALGWSDGGVSLFRLSLKRVEQSGKATSAAKRDPQAQTALTLEPIRELSLGAWGYAPDDVGSVTALAWSHDGRSVVAGYALRGFSLFSTDGCRLMSSLPQHNQERPEKIDEHNMKEVCAFGVLDLLWTKESNSLVVVPRGEQSTQLFQLPEDEILREVEEENEVEVAEVAHLYETAEAKVQKGVDGLCLSLSGAPGRCGAWVRSDRSFTRRARDGGVGPAETCGQIQGGDLLVGINDNLKVVNLPFEQIVSEIKELPDNEEVVLTFMRLNWEDVFPLAVEALSSSEFMDAHGIHMRDDENLCIREYALRMQAVHGDCDLEERPPLMEFERRAKFDGWEAIQGTSTRVAKHKYVKLLFALFPVWNPNHFLNVITEYWNALLAQKLYIAKQKRLKELHDHRQLVKMRQRPSMAFAEFDFAKTVPLSGGRSSRLALLENKSVRLVAAPSLDDPCAVTSCVNWSVPAEFEKCCPLRLVALSASGNHMAVAGQRGFCLLNVVNGKWRMFGNVNDEQDMFVYSLLWVDEDALVVNFTRFSEKHQSLHLQAYPRNHLDEESILEQLVFGREGENAARSRGTAALGGRSIGDDADDCFFIMDSDNAHRNLFCVSRSELWCFDLKHGGTIKQNDLRMEIQLKRQVNLPSRVVESQPVGTCRRNAILDFAVLPRFLHIQDEKLREQQQRKYQAEREHEHDDEGWISSFVNMLVGGEVPDQYTPEEVLPRFAFLDSAGDVIVWDPENRSQRLLCSNVSTMARLFVTPQACASWPAPCRLIYGLYGPDGMKVWLPLLDGVYMTHTKAFEQDSRRLETFLACHDPLRAKTYEIEFGTAPATAELYEQVIREYGIALNGFLSSGTGVGMGTGRMPLRDGYSNLRGCVTSVDDPSAKDRMLRFDFDVKVLGAEQAFGLLVGVSQDVYVPSGVLLPCYDVFARVQPIFHTLLCFLVQNEQLSWARLVMDGVRKQFALSTPTQELFLHSMLEACFAKKCPEEKLHTAIQLLRPGDGEQQPEGDIAEYCEIVAHVARKSEPSRLKVLFPAAGDPMDLLAICQQRSELRTAANFLLILEECSTASGSSLPLRMESAAELLKECVDQEEWVLAQHVVRVARDWGHPPFDDSSYSHAPSDSNDTKHAGTSIDEQLASLVWDNLVRGEYERVVWCVEDLQAKLPLKSPEERQPEEDSATILDRLYQIFIQGNKRRQLRILLQAVTEAQYDEWVARIKHVMEQ